MLKKRALTLTEVLVSMLIFSMIMVGLASLFLASKRHIAYTHSRMRAAELGRYCLDRLQMQVSQDTWDEAPNNPVPNNLLSVGKYKSTNNPFTTTYPDAEYTIVDESEELGFHEPILDNNTYYSVYNVSDKDNLRKVKLTICWQEPS